MSAPPTLSGLAERARTIAFSAAVAQLARLLGAPNPIGVSGPVGEERILFRAVPLLGFPPSDVAAIRLDPAPAGGWPAEMEVAFLGLYGPSSPLPSYWTERIARQEDGSANLRDLLDLFDHPLIALAYRIWRHYRLELRFDADATDPGSRAALALAGVFVDGIAAPDPDLDPLRLLPLAGLLAQHARSAEVLQRVLSGYFSIPVAIEEWVPQMAPIPLDQRFYLGDPAAALGRSSILGERIPDIVGVVSIVLGPLSAETFADFLPGGAARRSLRALLRVAVREPLECRVELIMAPDEAAGLVLGAGRLGWTTWQDGQGGVRRCPTGPA